jgi:hypothetical protein
MKMKQKLSVFLLFMIPIIMIGTELKAQSNWEVGMRFGDNIAVDATIPIGAAPRFHPALYITDRWGIGGYFDWMFALSDGPAGLKFYPGVGPEFFFENSFDFHIAGNFGVEYSFDFPLTIGFDWRPGFKVTEDFKGKAGNWGFIARFRIGEGKLVRAQ